jgi:hypothetical protein
MLCYCMSLYERLVNTGQQLIHNQWINDIKKILTNIFYIKDLDIANVILGIIIS